MIKATGQLKEDLIAMLPDFRMLRYPKSVVITYEGVDYIVKSKDSQSLEDVVDMCSSDVEDKSWSDILNISKSLQDKTLHYTM